MPHWRYYLLLMSLVAPIISLLGGGRLDLAIFIFSAIGLIPLAALIGEATENLEYYVGATAGGLLNATFGNAPEIIIGIFALQQGLISVVKASITGSIISNSLLVLGSSLAVGGWRFGRQYFNNRDSGQYSAMMVLAVAGLLIPFAGSIAIKGQARIQALSVAISVILLVVYMLYLALHVFHVRATRRNPKRRGHYPPRATPVSSPRNANRQEDEEVEAITGGVSAREIDEHRPPSPWFSVGMLLIAAIFTGWNSELLVGTIKPVVQQIGLSEVFIGLVIIPIIGNAAEHSSALVVAYKDRIDLTMAIAAGSSIQVATFVAPILVLISLFFPTHLDLLFQPLELAVLGLATILFTFISLDGESTWLAGVQLVAVYVMAGVVFFMLS